MASTDWAKVGRRGLTSAITPLGRTADGYNYTGLPNGKHSDSCDENRFVGQTQPINYSGATAGQVEALQTIAGRVNNIKSTAVGDAYVELTPVANSGNNNSEQVLSSRTNTIISGVNSNLIPHTYYKMQGYFVSGAVYETWVSVDAPNFTPPSGHSLINIAIISIFRQPT